MRKLDNFTGSILEHHGLPRDPNGIANRILRAIIGAEKMESVFNELDELESLSEFFGAYFDHQNINLQVQNQSRIPETGACAIVANHPTGLLEVMALLKLILEVRQDVKILGNFMLAELEGWRDYVLPVYLSPEDNKKAADNMQKQYEDEGLMLILPSGLTSVKKRGVIREQPWSGAFINKACKANNALKEKGAAPVTIVPAKVTAQASHLFYGLQNLSPVMSEFLFLREALKQAGKNMGIEFLGSEQVPDELDKSQIQAATQYFQRLVEQF